MKNDHIVFNQRKIKKNYRSITGHFPSVKNNKSIGFESKLEKALFLVLEFDNTVLSYQEQPQIEIFFKGKTRTYSADCYIKRVENFNLNGTLVESKYIEELLSDEKYFEKKFEAVRISAKELGLDFEVFTEENHSEVYLDNIDFLYRYKLNPQKNKYENQILTLLGNKKLAAYDLAKQITSNHVEYALVSNFIWDLVAQEKLKTDLENKKLTMNSLVEVANG
jgi:hypothetical protein